MKVFLKNNDKYKITDNQALIKEYGQSPAKEHIIKNSMKYVLSKFKMFVDSILKMLTDKYFKKAFAVVLTSCFENREFPINQFYFEMEIKRMPFDFFGRLK